MRIRHRLAVLAAVLLLPSLAFAADEGWYVAFDTGHSSFADHTGFASSVIAPVRRNVIVTPATYSDGDSGYRLTGGYQFSQNWGLELSDVRLGKQSARTSLVTFPSSISCGLPCEDSYVADAKREIRGWSLTATGSWPFADQWSLFGHAGFIAYHSELDTDVTPISGIGAGNGSVPPSVSGTVTGLKPTYGFGVKWSFAEHWDARLGWDRYQNMGDASTGTTSVNLASLGVGYRF